MCIVRHQVFTMTSGQTCSYTRSLRRSMRLLSRRCPCLLHLLLSQNIIRSCRNCTASSFFSKLHYRNEPYKVTLIKLRNVMGHIIKLIRFEIKDVQFDLAHGMCHHWLGKSMKDGWTWDNASTDPKTRICQPCACALLSDTESCLEDFE